MKIHTLFISLVLIGCQSQAHREIDVPCAWQHGEAEPSSPSFVWWEALQDPVLCQLIRCAEQQNLDLSIAEQRINEARGTEGKIDASEEWCDTWTTLTAEIGRNYVELRGMQLRLQVLKENIGTQEDTLHLTEELLRIGKGSTVDLKQAEEQLHLLQAKKPILETSIDKAIHRLSVLLGGFPGELCIHEPGTLPQVPENAPIGRPCELLHNRVDIRKEERKKTCYEYKKTVLEALEEVENALAAFQSQRRSNQKLEEALKANRDSYTLMVDLYQKGFKDYLEVLVVNRSMLEVEDAFIQGQVELLLNYIALFKALGKSC